MQHDYKQLSRRHLNIPTFAIGQTMSGQLRDQSQPQFSLTLKAVPLEPIDASRQRAIILVSPSKNIRMEPSMNSFDQNLPSSAASAAEVRRLLEENARLRSLLIAHRIPIPEAAKPTLHLPQILNAVPESRKSRIATAKQRIALFRSLFRGREDIFAVRWENNDGRSGYMPKADRDWKSYLNAKDEDRKKVDRLTRTYWPLTDDVIHGHLVGEQTVGIYGDEEQTGGFFTMIEEHLALPFSVGILGVEAIVEKVDMARDGRIVAICKRDGVRQRIEILDLPLPSPIPAGAEWIAAYSHWRRGF